MNLVRKAVAAGVLCLALCVGVSAQAQTEITGPDSAAVGESVQLDIAIPGGGYSQVSFHLDLDLNQIQVLNLTVAPGWELEQEGEKVILHCKDSAEQNIHMLLSLRIRPVTAQTIIRVSVANVMGYQEEKQIPLGDAELEIRVAEPPSSDNYLTALSVEDGVLSPGFHRSITQYTATVPAQCDRPLVYAVGVDKSITEVTQTEFDKDNTCLVSIAVTAENGSQRVYTITVTREEAPPTEATAVLTTASGSMSQTDSQAKLEKPQESGVPGWILVVALLAGAALGGAGGILLSQRKKN